MKLLLWLALTGSIAAQTLTLVVYKHERMMESWVSGTLVRSDSICGMSGGLGPKRTQGDLQVPEGVYRVVRFNPNSSYTLSFGIDYPNAVDKLLGQKPYGGDIYFHGKCVSAGCVSFTDEQIRSIYPFVKAFKSVQVLIFPGREQVFNLLESGHTSNLEATRKHLAFWKSLRGVHEYWLKHKVAPKWRAGPDGYLLAPDS